MANDRMWLVCRYCGGYKLLFKTFGMEISMWDSDDVAAFIRQHAIECAQRLPEFGRDTMFHLMTDDQLIQRFNTTGELGAGDGEEVAG